MIGSLNNIALAGVQNGLDKLQKNAGEIAGAYTAAGTNTQSLVEAVVDLGANVQQVSASMKTLQVSDELIGTILDIKL
jgi:hypothetical protein